MTVTFPTNDAQAAENVRAIEMCAPLFQAYLECNAEIQQHAKELFAILTNPETDVEDRHLTATTLADLLFPNVDDYGRLKGRLGMDLEEAEKQGAEMVPEARETLQRMDEEEADFATRLRDAISASGMTQADIAEKIGVGQPAISMMLNRKCRPQRRTIEKLSEALKLTPRDLWPSFGR